MQTDILYIIEFTCLLTGLVNSPNLFFKKEILPSLLIKTNLYIFEF